MTHTIAIPYWHPHRLNELMGCYWRAARLKKEDRELVAWYGRDVPRATGRRRVRLVITLAPRQRAGDPDAYWKSTLDALTAAGLLVDDNRQGVELVEPVFVRGEERSTRIILEDLSGHG